MAAFSSRGSSGISPEILKPDIVAPGLNILAAWTEGNSPTKTEGDHKRDLNYPAFSFPKLNGKVKRTVTNVGEKGSVYFVSVEPPLGISVKVSACFLHIKIVGEKKSFQLTVEGNGKVEKGVNLFDRINWSDAVHIVRSPIAVSLV